MQNCDDAEYRLLKTTKTLQTMYRQNFEGFIGKLAVFSYGISIMLQL